MGVDISRAQRVRLRVEGTVQGVGFRPYVYRLANSLGLGGFVRNDTAGVLVEVEGDPAALGAFVERLPAELPPLARCDRITTKELSAIGDRTFIVAASAVAERGASALVMPDTATCSDCLVELFDPDDRRYRYPFINCTNCGPRFTIIRGIPYDRVRTTMAGFRMCPCCHAEYVDPGNRRFHAQPNACPACGPTARLVDASGQSIRHGTTDAVAAAAAAILDGAVVAVKGIGGYHLACRADTAMPVERLRRRKHRADKPFAIMVRDVDAARRLVSLNAAEIDLLTSRERPIVLARRRAEAAVADAVAPRQRDLGLMLPYTPLHHLLLADVSVSIVLTSGNLSDEPIAYQDGDALTRLATVADAFLTHDRPIERAVDDSVARVVRVGTVHHRVMLRRSRGYVPAAMPLPVDAPDGILACGGQLKNTVCLARGDRAWVGPHTGDLECYETFRSFTDGIAHLERLLSVVPRRIAYDLHPEYLSTKYALDRLDTMSDGGVGVQHHHAHLAACLAEHGERGPVLGVVFDGTGYGTDGAIWGGELLVSDLTSFERVGHLWPVAMPGGSVAVREPWRMACAWLAELSSDVPDCPLTFRDTGVTPNRWDAVARLARSALSPRTTSMGRLLDAVAALCGVRHRVSYEGQAAIELEALADPDECGRYPCPVVAQGDSVVLDARKLVCAVMHDLMARAPVGRIAACVHNGVAYATWRACVALARTRGIDTVVLSGGVFQNVLLLERTASWLVQGGYRVLIPERIPVNDGGVAYGQVVIAAARDHARKDGVALGSHRDTGN